MTPINVLMTNTSLAWRCGTELYIRDLALALKKRGHFPMAFSPVLGEVAVELRDAGIEVSDRLNTFSRSPDLIHGQHHLETMAAVTFFKNVPAVYICHGSQPWEEHPPRFPRILKYVAVDEGCRERVVKETGVNATDVELVLNFVDLERFKARSETAAKPRRALLYSNMATPLVITPAVEAACRKAGLDLDVVGYRMQKPCNHPEDLLPQYDLVFAVGRSALEAMACGCGVILASAVGFGPLVTPFNFDSLRLWNFGFRKTTLPHNADLLLQEIKKYRPEEVEAVCRRIREEAGLESVATRWEKIYEKILQEARGRTWQRDMEAQAMAAYLQNLALQCKQILSEFDTLAREKQILEAQAFHYASLGVVRLRQAIRRFMGLD